MLLKKEITKISHFIDLAHKKSSAISDKGIGWHLDHSLIILINVSNILQKSNPSEYTFNFNFKKFLILTLNFIPRGKGKAPKSVYPLNTISKEDLHKKLAEANQLLSNTMCLPESNFKHPVFGVLNLKKTFKF